MATTITTTTTMSTTTMNTTTTDHDHEHGRRRLVAPPDAPGHAALARLGRQGRLGAWRRPATGLRALWISLAVLGATAVLQAVVVVLSGSVALLGDTLHNVADALTAVPLGIAFVLGRRPPTRRYTYGFGRAEDLAGIVIVVFIAASSALAGYEAIDRLIAPRRGCRTCRSSRSAAVIGFAGNEIVARYRITVGRRIGSAALVADGLHARTDGFTSLAVLLGAGRRRDRLATGPTRSSVWSSPSRSCSCSRTPAREVYRRLMDAVDPALVDPVAATLRGTPGVVDVGEVHLRWIGHQLRAECEITVDGRPVRAGCARASRSTPSIGSCTPCPGCPARSCTPIPEASRSNTTRSWRRISTSTAAHLRSGVRTGSGRIA